MVNLRRDQKPPNITAKRPRFQASEMRNTGISRSWRVENNLHNPLFPPPLRGRPFLGFRAWGMLAPTRTRLAHSANMAAPPRAPGSHCQSVLRKKQEGAPTEKRPARTRERSLLLSGESLCEEKSCVAVHFHQASERRQGPSGMRSGMPSDGPQPASATRLWAHEAGYHQVQGVLEQHLRKLDQRKAQRKEEEAHKHPRHCPGSGHEAAVDHEGASLQITNERAWCHGRRERLWGGTLPCLDQARQAQPAHQPHPRSDQERAHRHLVLCRGKKAHRDNCTKGCPRISLGRPPDIPNRDNLSRGSSSKMGYRILSLSNPEPP